MRTGFLVVALAIASARLVTAQDPPAPAQEPSQETGGQSVKPEGQESPSPIRPYGRVVTKDAKTTEGVFKIHRIRDRLLYEIPKTMLGREFLWVTQIAKTAEGAGYGGQPAGDRVVKWEQQGDRVLLRSIAYDIVADDTLPIARAVHAANYDAIVMAFTIQTVGKDDAPVIDVTRLFTADVPEMSARAVVRARALDSSRSFIERAVAFPENIEVEATHTFSNPPDGPGPTLGSRARSGSASLLMHFSMVLLPATPMRSRLFDERVGYFSIQQLDYGKDEHRSPRRQYITRWRLEKKDPAASVSEPVKPIVYYIDPATPPKWVPYLKRGVEAWQPAFEAAGFRNAIVARDAPSSTDDPDWSPEDARYSVIRWLPSTTENAQGPHVHDPRTGEILNADVQFHQNVMNLVRDWYFLQVGPLDLRAKTLPLPDDLMGRLLQFVTSHEVGHTLGLQHNMKASSLYPAAKLRDREWLKKMGHTPSIMDYARFNYVAQPEDRVDAPDLIPNIGPYDMWAIGWGYRPIPEAAAADAEKSTLDGWARTQDSSPWLRFSTADARGSDPGELAEAIGDQDAIWSTTQGLKNLERVSKMLLPASTRPGEPYTELDELYGRLLGQWATELTHVTAIVGGFDSQQKHAGQDGVRFVPVPRDKQIAAVVFLNANAFHVPAFLINAEILRRIEPAGELARVRTAQLRVLDSLLSTARILRLVEQEALDGEAAYKPTEFLRDVRRGLWSEAYGEKPGRVDAYRRNLQRAYVDALAERVNGRQAASNDVRAFFRGELKTLDADLRSAQARALDPATRMHFADVRTQIARALDPTVQAPAQPIGVNPAVGVDEAVIADPIACWPDYAVR
jgi:hypothetical protein